MTRLIPERLTLVDARDPARMKTVVVDDEMYHLVIEATDGASRIEVKLNETQAKKLRARIDKFFRDNR